VSFVGATMSGRVRAIPAIQPSPWEWLFICHSCHFPCGSADMIFGVLGRDLPGISLRKLPNQLLQIGNQLEASVVILLQARWAYVLSAAVRDRVSDCVARRNTFFDVLFPFEIRLKGPPPCIIETVQQLTNLITIVIRSSSKIGLNECADLRWSTVFKPRQ
jgi:hypothetical protein